MVSHKDIAIQYARDVVSGKVRANKKRIAGCRRFLADLEREDLELHTKEPEFVIGIIERIIVHEKGEDRSGAPMRGKPYELMDWQIFVVYNLVGFYYRGTKKRRFHEGLIFIPRKNAKTTFIGGLGFALALLQRASGAELYIVAASTDQALQSFDFIKNTIEFRKMQDEFHIIDNHAAHSISKTFYDADGNMQGSLEIRALASNPKAHDSFNCNLAIVDELHAVSMSEYMRFKEAMSAYENKLIIGITTAGDNANSFCYRHLEYAYKVVEGIVTDDSFFAFICEADKDEHGDVDYLSAEVQEEANPSYGITKRPEELMDGALQAANDPQKRKDYLSRQLNVYTTAKKAYFDIEKFRESDKAYNWTLEELAHLPIQWFGGADLSRLHDLTAAALFGNYQGVDIIITHGFFPVVAAHKKAVEDNIPLFGWQDDGWLTMTNDEVVNHAEIVKWFKDMRNRGFRIKEVGHDRKFCREYFVSMKRNRFNIIDQPQYFYKKSEGFRRIETSALTGKLYYLHSDAFEYCVSNVHAIEKETADDMVEFGKIEPTQRIDLFDASVFAAVRFLENMTNEKNQMDKWFG